MNQSNQLTQQQEDQIKNEVKVVLNSATAKFERLDIDGVMQYFWDSPEFVDYNADGSRYDFQTMKKVMTDVFGSATAAEIATASTDLTVLAKDAVLCAWVSRVELTLKSGDKVAYDPNAETYVFKRIADQWKIIYTHQSATISVQKAG